MANAMNCIFERKTDPSEGAFNLLVPKGWLMEGGILRANLMMERISAQNMEAKVDFSVKRDSQGSVMIRWCPEVKYCDPRWTITGQMGWMQPGGNYQGMIVWPLQPANQFLAQMMFAWAHPQAQNAQLLTQQVATELLQKHQRQALQNGVQFQYDAATITYTYSEFGVQYKEQATTVIENMGQLGAGMWSNKESYYMRAPLAEFDDWLPVLTTIYQSVVVNRQWAAQEMQRQGILMGSFREAQQAEQYRARKALETQQYLQQVGREINEHHSLTQAEIRNDQYLIMTNQEEYINPITNEVDLGSNQWNYRWVNPNGDVFYSNSEGDNPNDLGGGVLDRRDWQRTPIRPRFPQ